MKVVISFVLVVVIILVFIISPFSSLIGLKKPSSQFLLNQYMIGVLLNSPWYSSIWGGLSLDEYKNHSCTNQLFNQSKNELNKYGGIFGINVSSIRYKEVTVEGGNLEDYHLYEVSFNYHPLANDTEK